MRRKHTCPDLGLDPDLTQRYPFHRPRSPFPSSPLVLTPDHSTTITNNALTCPDVRTHKPNLRTAHGDPIIGFIHPALLLFGSTVRTFAVINGRKWDGRDDRTLGHARLWSDESSRPVSEGYKTFHCLTPPLFFLHHSLPHLHLLYSSPSVLLYYTFNQLFNNSTTPR